MADILSYTELASGNVCIAFFTKNCNIHVLHYKIGFLSYTSSQSHGLVVNIAASHAVDPGSSPTSVKILLFLFFYFSFS